MDEQRQTLTDVEAREVLVLARSSLEHFVRSGRRLRAEQPFSGGLALPCGAFVTLHTKEGELRGCIGHMIGDGPLGDLILDLAVSAGTRDPRFPPVTVTEVDSLVYEVSVLSPMVVTDPAAVEVGRHGLYVRRGARSGVLLPQVASEWQWDRETFLAQTCRKAGLSPQAWREPGTEVLAFTAQVLREQAARPSS
jgi:hypothetical protein